MIPMMMTVKHNPPHTFGDCLRACIGSILGINPIWLPHPGRRGAEHWNEEMKVLDRWLATHGYWTLGLRLKEADFPLYQEAALGYYILGGTSPRGYGHYVVAHGREIVHDPHPDGGGVVVDSDGTWTMLLVCYGTKDEFLGRPP